MTHMCVKSDTLAIDRAAKGVVCLLLLVGLFPYPSHAQGRNDFQEVRRTHELWMVFVFPPQNGKTNVSRLAKGEIIPGDQLRKFVWDRASDVFIAFAFPLLKSDDSISPPEGMEIPVNSLISVWVYGSDEGLLEPEILPIDAVVHADNSRNSIVISSHSVLNQWIGVISADCPISDKFIDLLQCDSAFHFYDPSQRQYRSIAGAFFVNLANEFCEVVVDFFASDPVATIDSNQIERGDYESILHDNCFIYPFADVAHTTNLIPFPQLFGVCADENSAAAYYEDNRCSPTREASKQEQDKDWQGFFVF